ncbi:caspase family protein, partial [bacterium]|nr:caspase family protein [bacterium]
MRKIAFILVYLLVFTSLTAQTKSRGISNVGKIIKSKVDQAINEIFGENKQPDLTCTVLFQEPSKDGILGEGETGEVLVGVHNNSMIKQIQPKLEIVLKSSWNPTPHSVVKFMDPIEPGQSGQYEAKMRWDKRLPSGIVTYKVVAVDVNSRVKSKPVELNFSITGKGTKEAEPVFVDVDKTIPKVYASNRYGVAVIIGNQEYSNRDIPDVDYAVKDAAAMKKYLINMLGYREENIIYVENAQKTDFESIFGTDTEFHGKLYNYVRPNESDIFIYYSGHGAPDLSSKKAYFMPSNSDPNYVKIYGYPLDVFYKNIDKIPAKSITVVLDACFSGGSQQGMLIKNASPMYI